MIRCQSLGYERGTPCLRAATVRFALHFPCGCSKDIETYGCDEHGPDPTAYCTHCREPIAKSEPVSV